MPLNLGDTFPQYTFDTTDGKIDFHEWLGDRLVRAVCIHRSAFAVQILWTAFYFSLALSVPV